MWNAETNLKKGQENNSENYVNECKNLKLYFETWVLSPLISTKYVFSGMHERF